MKNYEMIKSEIQDTEMRLKNERIELALCLIKYIREILNTELTIDGSTKTVRDFLISLPEELVDLLKLIPGNKTTTLLNYMSSIGLASLMNDDRLSEVVQELKMTASLVEASNSLLNNRR